MASMESEDIKIEDSTMEEPKNVCIYGFSLARISISQKKSRANEFDMYMSNFTEVFHKPIDQKAGKTFAQINSPKLVDEMEVKKHKADLDTQNPRKRQRIHKGTAIEELPDDIIVAILSRMNIKDAVRTSVLSTRWKYLWKFMSVTLEFHDKDIATRKKLEAFVNRVLELYNRVDSLVIRFSNTRKKTESAAIDKWIYSAMLKQLCIRASDATKDLRVVDPLPNLKELKISDCCNLQSLVISATNLKELKISDCCNLQSLVISATNLKELEISDCCSLQSLVISAMNLVSCTYQGREIKLSFKKTPNELTLGGVFCKSFIYEPNKHSTYSDQLVKLVLNLQTENVQMEVCASHH
ncbi:hypothetical protein MIMGU_mgv1a009094mg [Erythranthe guttata]|uniref:F-box domain-containing protein n=1 Tax=Erythranthe guttata TaxID=4155 RepID=A0A022QJX9_ERYGU|nr:hypothetical protein MIMGU_mgv1a009094mg [Erythranthe guttata]